ncbi:MAG: ATP-binding cassette domain-containing protein [Chloroflexota bacterium]
MPQISVQNLTKTYRVPERESGLLASLTSLVQRQYRDVKAVQAVNFTIEPGEMVALLGPNGAGKTTTLKMLAGLLRPSSGEATVAGFVPWERQHDYLRRISMVLGNKSQMLWDIPPLDTFTVLAEIHQISHSDFQHTLDELVNLLEMEPLLNKPVRNLSLGERMKCELVASLIHRPRVLFLDEPTLGLDVSMQRRLRQFLTEYNRQSEVTMILTSHYMADVVALCRRVILIHHGEQMYDGSLQGLAKRLAPFKLIRVTLGEAINGGVKLPTNAEVVTQETDSLTLRSPRDATPAVTAQLLQTLPVVDLAVEDPPIEAVMDQIYSGGNL